MDSNLKQAPTFRVQTGIRAGSASDRAARAADRAAANAARAADRAAASASRAASRVSG